MQMAFLERKRKIKKIKKIIFARNEKIRKWPNSPWFSAPKTKASFGRLLVWARPEWPWPLRFYDRSTYATVNNNNNNNDAGTAFQCCSAARQPAGPWLHKLSIIWSYPFSLFSSIIIIIIMLARVCLIHSASSVPVEGLFLVTGIIKNAGMSSITLYTLNKLT